MNDFRRIEDDIKTGAIDKPHVFLLYGKESYLAAHYTDKLAAYFGGGGNPALDHATFYAGKSEKSEASADAKNDNNETADSNQTARNSTDITSDIISACESVPMASPYRVVVVKNAKSLFDTDDSTLTDALGTFPETTRLIFTFDEPISKTKKDTSSFKTKALFKALAKSIGIYEFDRLERSEIDPFINKRFKSAGIEIPTPILSDFIDRTGYFVRDSDINLFNVEGETQKIILYVQSEGRAKVESSDLDICMGPNFQTDVFELANAISEGRKKDAVRLLEYRFAGDDKESIFRILPNIIYQFETMAGLKDLEARGEMSMAKALEILPMKYEWQINKLKNAARGFTTQHLRHLLHKLYNIDTNIKSGDVPENLALTLFIAEM